MKRELRDVPHAIVDFGTFWPNSRLCLLTFPVQRHFSGHLEDSRFANSPTAVRNAPTEPRSFCPDRARCRGAGHISAPPPVSLSFYLHFFLRDAFYWQKE